MSSRLHSYSFNIPLSITSMYIPTYSLKSHIIIVPLYHHCLIKSHDLFHYIPLY